MFRYQRGDVNVQLLRVPDMFVTSKLNILLKLNSAIAFFNVRTGDAGGQNG